ncbi:MAG: apolipoprotein N-acyltransferase, partial [Gammaproteobacteria bacterium]
VKQKLVPFGESLPFPSITHKLGPLFNLSRYGFTPGEADQRPLTAQGMQIAPFICYEIVFPSLVRRQAAEADLLLTISNDGWFGQSFGPDQHFQMSRMRALETGKMLLRVTNNGITAIIDEQGHVISRLKTFTRATLSGVAYSTTGQTPFMLLGSWPTLIVILGILIAGIMTRVLHHYFKTNQVPTTDQNWHTLSPHSEPSTLTQEPPYVCDATHPR